MKAQLDTVICAIDLSDGGHRVLAYGTILSRHLGARLVLCHVVDNVPPPLLTAGSAADFAGLQRRRFAEARFFLGQMLERAGRTALQGVEVVQGSAAEQLRRMAGRSGTSMVVAATRRLSWLERLTRESVTGRLLADSPLSVLSVPPGPLFLAGPEVARIVVGYDFSTGAQGALAMGLILARSSGAELRLVRVQKESRCHRAPEKVRGLPVKTIGGSGRPDQVLARYAAGWGADLVVVGKRRKPRMLPLGRHSTAWRVMGRAVCPVLSVSPVFAGQAVPLGGGDALQKTPPPVSGPVA